MTKHTYAFLILFVAGSAMADETITVFQYDGSMHCHEVDTVQVKQARQELEAAGIKVISATSGVVPYELPGHCGTPTGKVNLLIVRRADWDRLHKTRPNTLGYGVWVFEQPNLEVYRYDGSLQCDRGKELSLSHMAEDLKANGIDIKASRKGRDRLARIAVCGASTGNLNIYTIAQDSLSRAQELGFRVLVSREVTTGIGGPAPVRRGSPQVRVTPRTAGSPVTPIPQLW